MSMMCRPKLPFLHMYGSHDMKLVDFRGLTGSQRTPRVWGVTTWVPRKKDFAEDPREEILGEVVGFRRLPTYVSHSKR